MIAPKKSKARWLKVDDKLLTDGIAAGLCVDKIAANLQRSPRETLGRTSTLDLFAFEPGTEEEREYVGLALSGVPLRDTIAWCLASDGRPTSARIDQLLAEGGFGDLRVALDLAYQVGLWCATESAPTDLAWLAAQDVRHVQVAMDVLTLIMETPTPSGIRKVMEGKMKIEGRATVDDVCDQAAARGYVPVIGGYGRKKPSTSARKSKSASGASKTRSPRKGRGRRRNASPSVPQGAPLIDDTRSASSSAWEKKTSFSGTGRLLFL